ncbi:MAG: copper chaperone PCu(A)C [Actinophytocola sp.]|nr:copper chaperone PCu(A)C [Actinophytocola sp.]
MLMQVAAQPRRLSGVSTVDHTGPLPVPRWPLWGGHRLRDTGQALGFWRTQSGTGRTPELMRQQNGRSFGRRLAVATLGVAASALLAGCSAGQLTQTDSHLAAVNGGATTAAQLSVSNAAFAYPEDDQRVWVAGSDVPLTMTIANNGEANDELVGVSSSLSRDIAVQGDTTIRAHKALTVDGETAEVANPPGGEIEAGEVGTARVTLRNITRDLFPGQVVTLTLTFADAGAVDLRVPIETPDEPRTAEPHSESESGH